MHTVSLIFLFLLWHQRIELNLRDHNKIISPWTAVWLRVERVHWRTNYGWFLCSRSWNIITVTVLGNERMFEDFTGSDPLLRIQFQHGLHELDTLVPLDSLSFVPLLQAHLVTDTMVKSTISQIIVTLNKKKKKKINHSYLVLTLFKSSRRFIKSLYFFWGVGP